MSASAERLLLDTSVALALASRRHELHTVVRERVSGHRLGLAGHAAFETYSVLTRWQPPSRLTPAGARLLIATNFPDTVGPPPRGPVELLETFERAGISGGAVYDGLVGAAALAAGLRLVTADARASATYAALGVEFELLG